MIYLGISLLAGAFAIFLLGILVYGRVQEAHHRDREAEDTDESPE